jgi:hypothetical protein
VLSLQKSAIWKCKYICTFCPTAASTLVSSSAFQLKLKSAFVAHLIELHAEEKQQQQQKEFVIILRSLARPTTPKSPIGSRRETLAELFFSSVPLAPNI